MLLLSTWRTANDTKAKETLAYMLYYIKPAQNYIIKRITRLTILSLLLLVNALTIGCATVPAHTNSPAIQAAVEKADRCTFNQSGQWVPLYWYNDEGVRLVFIAILPLDGPYDVEHIICLVPQGDPIMALGENRPT